MKKAFLVFLLLSIIAGCDSANHTSLYQNNFISEKKIRSDVDYTYKKLKKLHPKLYWYISKEALDYKFDSLKSTITKPMTSVEFYKKISPVIASIKQGHTTIYPQERKLSRKEKKALIKKGTGPLSQFEFEVYDNKLYVIRNYSLDKAIKPGTEVVAINNKSTTDLLQTYATRFASDGYNQTLKKYVLSRNFSAFYTFENDIQDSIRYLFKYNDSVKTTMIKRTVTDSVKTDENKKKEKDELGKIRKSKFGYNPETGEYNRNLRFMENDSSVAILSIKEFMIGDYHNFYDESFAKMQHNNTKTLIIDLRDNPGGRLDEIVYLYTYLADDTFIFLDDSQVVSKTSMFSGEYLSGGPFLIKIAKVLVAPVYYPYLFFKVHKKEDGNYYYSAETKPRSVKPLAFTGPIYVLINGGSISASSMISTNLKASGRAFFVGEETGGAFNGTVAGKMYVTKLPNSKLKMRFGLMYNTTIYESAIDGRGIFPDKTIIPTLEDHINGKDPEMEWILQQIEPD